MHGTCRYGPPGVDDRVRKALLATLPEQRAREIVLRTGLRCVAVALPASATPTATSVSGPASRSTLEGVPRIHPVLARTAATISADLSRHARSSGAGLTRP